MAADAGTLVVPLPASVRAVVLDSLPGASPQVKSYVVDWPCGFTVPVSVAEVAVTVVAAPVITVGGEVTPVVTVAALFEVLGSAWPPATVAVSVIVPCVVGFSWTATVALAPCKMVPREQTCVVVPAQVP
jgi:hypothetical protein